MDAPSDRTGGKSAASGGGKAGGARGAGGKHARARPVRGDGATTGFETGIEEDSARYAGDRSRGEGSDRELGLEINGGGLAIKPHAALRDRPSAPQSSCPRFARSQSHETQVSSRYANPSLSSDSAPLPCHLPQSCLRCVHADRNMTR